MRHTDRPATVLAAAAGAVLVAGLLTVATRPATRARPAAAPAGETPSPGGRPERSAPPAPERPQTPAPAQPSGTPRPGATPSARPSPAPPDSGGREWYEPDGLPGYGDGFVGCSPAAVPRDADLPAGVTFELRPIVTEVVPGTPLHAYVVVTNHGRERTRINIWYGQTAALLVDSAGRARSAMFWSDVVPNAYQNLGAGESAAFEVHGESVECGDTPGDDHPALPEGDYELVASGSWGSGEDDDLSGGRWATGRVPVRLDADADAAPCTTEENGCRVPKYWEEPQCETAERTGGDYGSERSLAIAVELDSDTVPPGENVTGEVVVTNTGSEPHWFMLTDPLGDGVVRSAGGLLGNGPGPFGLGPPAGGARWPWLHLGVLWTLDEVRRLDPGESVRVAVTLVTSDCAGQPLPEGSYRVRTGVYVAHWGWWVAPEADVTLTS